MKYGFFYKDECGDTQKMFCDTLEHANGLYTAYKKQGVKIMGDVNAYEENRVMLEKDDTRFEYCVRAIHNSNVDGRIHHIAYYVTVCQKLTFGSTRYDMAFHSKEEGISHFKEMLEKGFKRVTHDTKSFA